IIAGGSTNRGYATILNSKTFEEERVIDGHSSYLLHAAFSDDQKLIVTSGSDYFVRLWDAETGELINRIRHNQREVPVAVFADDVFVISYSDEIRSLQISASYKSRTKVPPTFFEIF